MFTYEALLKAHEERDIISSPNLTWERCIIMYSQFFSLSFPFHFPLFLCFLFFSSLFFSCGWKKIVKQRKGCLRISALAACEARETITCVDHVRERKNLRAKMAILPGNRTAIGGITSGGL